VPEDLDAGQLAIGSSAIPKDRNSGQPEGRSLGTAEGCEIRGNSKLHRRPSRRYGTRGNPSSVSEGTAGGREETGQPAESPKPVALEDAKFGATRRSIAGTAKGRGSGATRGIVARRGQRVRGTGQPGDARLAKPQDAGEGATRSPHQNEITVKVHRGQVMRKMNAASLPDLARMADKLNITTEKSQNG